MMYNYVDKKNGLVGLCSKEILTDHGVKKSEFEEQIFRDIEYINSDVAVKELVEDYTKLKRLNKKILLSAHGNVVRDNWVYFDNGKPQSIQKFIDKYDGKYGEIYLAVCNPEHKEVHSKKSVLFVPSGDYSKINLIRGQIQVEVFIPEFGYINNYLIDYYRDRIANFKNHS